MDYKWFLHFSFEINALLNELKKQSKTPIRDSVKYLYKKLFLSKKIFNVQEIEDFVFLNFLTFKSIYGKRDSVIKESVLLGIKKAYGPVKTEEKVKMLKAAESVFQEKKFEKKYLNVLNFANDFLEEKNETEERKKDFAIFFKNFQKKFFDNFYQEKEPLFSFRFKSYIYFLTLKETMSKQKLREIIYPPDKKNVNIINLAAYIAVSDENLPHLVRNFIEKDTEGDNKQIEAENDTLVYIWKKIFKEKEKIFELFLKTEDSVRRYVALRLFQESFCVYVFREKFFSGKNVETIPDTESEITFFMEKIFRRTKESLKTAVRKDDVEEIIKINFLLSSYIFFISTMRISSFIFFEELTGKKNYSEFFEKYKELLDSEFLSGVFPLHISFINDTSLLKNKEKLKKRIIKESVVLDKNDFFKVTDRQKKLLAEVLSEKAERKEELFLISRCKTLKCLKKESLKTLIFINVFFERQEKDLKIENINR